MAPQEGTFYRLLQGSFGHLVQAVHAIGGMVEYCGTQGRHLRLVIDPPQGHVWKHDCSHWLELRWRTQGSVLREKAVKKAMEQIADGVMLCPDGICCDICYPE